MTKGRVSVFRNHLETSMQGEMRLETIYSEIKTKFPELCDDNERFVKNGTTCGEPKWKHSVRSAIQHLKKKGKINVVKRGVYNIHHYNKDSINTATNGTPP